MPGIVADLCKKADIPGHVQVGVSSIGGSRVIQHWNIADDKNKAKEALKTGKVDVLTLSPIFLPDPGIENFTKLALEHNKDIRILVQPIWLRWDIYEPTTKRPEKVDHNAITGEELRKRHAVVFQGDGRAHPRAEQEAGQDGALRGAGAAGRHRPAREDHRGQGPRAEDAGGPVHRRARPRQAAAAGAGRLLQFRGDVPPQPGRVAGAQRS